MKSVDNRLREENRLKNESDGFPAQTPTIGWLARTLLRAKLGLTADIQPGEQLQQQRAEVSQHVTQAGDWVRQTDQTISETSMARVVKADTEQRELVSRETTVKATDKITVLGTSTLLAGAIQQVCTGDYSQAVNNRVASIGGNDETEIAGSQTVTTGKDLIEKIGQIRKSVAAVQQ